MKNYEEAAKVYGKRFIFIREQTVGKNGFLAGASHAAQEERKEAWNEAIEKCILQLRTERSNGHIISEFSINRLEKLKV